MATKWTLLPIHATKPQIWICWTVSELDKLTQTQASEEVILQPVVSHGYTCAEDCSEPFPGRAFFLEPIDGHEGCPLPHSDRIIAKLAVGSVTVGIWLALRGGFALFF